MPHPTPAASQPTHRRPARAARAVAAMLLAGCASIAARADDDELKRLVEQIARGSDVESADAAERLVERVVRPVADAFGSLESRPPAEQRRLRDAMSRIAAALRVRVFRADLKPDEIKLFDDFLKQYPEVVHRLFDANFRVRLDALSNIPLEPDTAAGLLIAARVDDEDETVAMAALSVAAELHDRVLGRRLARYVQDATQSMRDGLIGRDDSELAATLALIIGRACLVLDDCGVAEAVPAIIEALKYFAKPRFRAFFPTGDILDGLGRLGDEQAAPAMIALLNESEVRYTRRSAEGRTIVQAIGDAALLNLLAIFKLSPETFGFDRAPEVAPPEATPDPIDTPERIAEAVYASPRTFHGFVDQADRERAVRAFIEWHTANAKLPAAERRPPTSQPIREP